MTRVSDELRVGAGETAHRLPVRLLVCADRRTGRRHVDERVTSRPIYLDSMATTPLAPEAREAMEVWFDQEFGNPSSSTHEFGWNAADAVEASWETVADLVGAARSDEVVFTSGATESNNTVIQGVLQAFPALHIVTTAIEHASVLAPCRVAQTRGAAVTFVSPDSTGVVTPEAISAAIRPDTQLISVMAVNNEVGTTQPLSEISAFAKSKGLLMHVDAAQAVGKIAFDVCQLDIDLASVSAHKLYGPKGVGALYVKTGTIANGLPALLHGGGQERGLRAGTLPVPQIVGFAAAAGVAKRRMHEDALHVAALHDLFWDVLRRGLPNVHLNGSTVFRIPGCLNISIDGVVADALISSASQIAISAGSACSSRSNATSHVLSAMGIAVERQRSAVRISLGRYTTQADVMAAAEALVAAARAIRTRPERGARSRLTS